MQMIYLICAIFGGTVLLLQFGLQFMGLAGDMADGGGDFSGDAGGDMADGGDFDGADGDHVHDGGIPLFKIISFQTVVAACAFFGLTGKAATASGFAQMPTLVIAIAAGLSSMYAVYYLASLLHRFNSDGTVRIDNAVGQPATVYISIPGDKQGVGKVQMTIQGRIMEYAAQTEDEERLPSGERVHVIDVIGPDTVEVARIDVTEPTVDV